MRTTYAIRRRSQAGIDAWNEKVDEIIGFGEPWPKEKQDDYNREHPLPTQEEIDACLERYRNG